MNEPILYVDRSSIGAGNLEEVKVLQKELASFIEANEPQLISYGIFISEDGSHMAVTAVHPDSASLLFHMEVGGPIFRKFQGLITLETALTSSSNKDELQDMINRGVGVVAGAGLGRSAGTGPAQRPPVPGR